MTDPLLVDAVRLMHIMGLSLGLGLALFADARFLGALAQPIRAPDVALLRQIHVAVSIAMGFLWLSGLLLLAVRTGWDLSALTPKLMAKLTVVTILTGNAILIARVALPTLGRSLGRSLVDLSLRRRLRLLSLGAVSAVSWGLALCLGVLGITKTLEAATLAAMISAAYGTALTGAGVLALILPHIRAGGPEPVRAAVRRHGRVVEMPTGR